MRIERRNWRLTACINHFQWFRSSCRTHIAAKRRTHIDIGYKFRSMRIEASVCGVFQASHRWQCSLSRNWRRWLVIEQTIVHIGGGHGIHIRLLCGVLFGNVCKLWLTGSHWIGNNAWNRFGENRVGFGGPNMNANSSNHALVASAYIGLASLLFVVFFDEVSSLAVLDDHIGSRRDLVDQLRHIWMMRVPFGGHLILPYILLIIVL
mmetsp:Transcript_72120/g.114957  ORF Transcript_72120/g.114957 Transcript_72120/m.114957 type:complete len:207 (+) Transcript_72120:39-659(+)